MEITYLGHSSFLIKDSKGRLLLTDPYEESVGYPSYKGRADVITISHHHADHDYVAEVQGNPEILDKIGFFNLCDIPISGIHSYHDTTEGMKRGDNTIYAFEMDGYKLCHLGDLGHLLTKDVIDTLGVIDILFVPVGGNYTIDGGEASQVCKQLKSHVVIPMHYKTQYLNFPIDGLENFLSKMKSGDRVNSNTLSFNEKLTNINVVKILNPTL
ncbi:MAG: MBL fold metallo-hydrolase [Clostridiaceae bacterium]|nr:MBL fold metallo-hydrolase [Clostridiaceae bacterium]